MFKNNYYTLEVDALNGISYQPRGAEERIPFSWPQFEINGRTSGNPTEFREIRRTTLTDTITEIVGEGILECGAKLTMELRVSEYTPMIRFRYLLSAADQSSEACLNLTKTSKESLVYLTYPTDVNSQRTEVLFSNYDQLSHSYQLAEIPAFSTEEQLMGPILTEQKGDFCLLTAYEHGSQYPDKFVVFEQTEDKIALRALRGNYWNGHPVCENAYETIWLQVGAVKGTIDDMAKAYREFQLKYCTLNAESRKPYIFYNTWAFQERNKFYNNSMYLASMNKARMEEEIDVAHEMGIEDFVIDTGWYQKTGDWEVDLKKFPDGMQSVRKKLEDYGMKLGLWFNPTVAAKTSKLLMNYADSISMQHGIKPDPWPIWETEESYPMCLVSEYWEAFADYLIYLVDNLGVTYFKWDAISQYGCDRRDHFHGGAGSTEEEARDCYGFLHGLYMSKIIDRICQKHPEVIVDFDVTEGGRYVGLGFLSSGKYFAMNNGPYFPNYDITVPEDVWINIFVHPGPARGWICRQVLCYDKWIPSTLMMTHYLPDDPAESQLQNIASLILGQNGIWGDLPGVSKEGRERFNTILSVYKKVREDITEAYPVTLGRPGYTLEVHEKISAAGRGVVVLFTNANGKYEYKIQNPVKTDKVTIFGAGKLVDADSQPRIIVDGKGADAVIVFFE